MKSRITLLQSVRLSLPQCLDHGAGGHRATPLTGSPHQTKEWHYCRDLRAFIVQRDFEVRLYTKSFLPWPWSYSPASSSIALIGVFSEHGCAFPYHDQSPPPGDMTREENRGSVVGIMDRRHGLVVEQIQANRYLLCPFKSWNRG